MKLNEKLIKLRKEQGLSQEEFGNEINVSRQAISKWESGTTKPDIEKIKEIALYFNVSFDYLLNDEINSIEELPKKEEKKKNKHTLFKILLIIFFIYLLISLYKFIALFRYYKIADSFSEENYWMNESWESNNEFGANFNTKKIGNRVIKESFTDPFSENPLLDENGNSIPYDINFYDYDKQIAYNLWYDEETKLYHYRNRKEDCTTEEEWQELMREPNFIKETTFGFIPSNLKSIFLASINPMYQVYVHNNTIYTNYFNKMKNRVVLNNDCLIWYYDMQTEFDGSMGITYSYDYVQDHFPKELKDPVEVYKDKIDNYSEIDYIK